MVLINLHRNLHEKSSFLSEIMFIRINPYLCHLLTRYQSTIFPNHKSCVRKKGVPLRESFFILLRHPILTGPHSPDAAHSDRRQKAQGTSALSGPKLPTGIGSIRKMVHDQSSGPARNRTKELLRKKFGGLRHKHYFCNLLKLLFLWNSKVSYIKSCP